MILSCDHQASPDIIFANQSGLDMLETTSSALQGLDWQKTLDDNGKKSLCADFAEVIQRVSINVFKEPNFCVTS